MPGHVIVAGHGRAFAGSADCRARGRAGTLVPGACRKIPPGMSTFEWRLGLAGLL